MTDEPTDRSGPLEPPEAERSGPVRPAGQPESAEGQSWLSEQDGSPAPADSRPNVDRALGVETVVTPEKGRWAVDIVVVFPDGVVRERIDTFPTEARAYISARLIKRAAERDIRGPLNG